MTDALKLRPYMGLFYLKYRVSHKNLTIFNTLKLFSLPLLTLYLFHDKLKVILYSWCYLLGIVNL